MSLLRALITLCCSFSLSGQTYTINTFAGGTLPTSLLGTAAGLSDIGGVAVDSTGNVFMTSGRNHTVLRLDAKTRVLSLVAGNGTPGYSGDGGIATTAQLNQPRGIAVDLPGNIYIADSLNRCVRKVSNGLITTVAGGGELTDNNIPATSAQLFMPLGLAIDSSDHLFIADSFDNRIRSVSAGIITTIAGDGTAGFIGDGGPALNARLSNPGAVALDSAGNLYIAESSNRIRMISAGVISTIIGKSERTQYAKNESQSGASLSSPSGVAVDSAGNVYVADTSNHRILKLSNGLMSTVAGTGISGFNGDDRFATSAELWNPTGIAVDAFNNMYIIDYFNNRLRKISLGIISTAARMDTPDIKMQGALATSVQLNQPSAVALDSAGNLYVVDAADYRVRSVINHVIATVAGNGTRGSSGDDGPARFAQLMPTGVTVDSMQDIYVVDSLKDAVRKVSNGVITTVVENVSDTFGPDRATGLGVPGSISGIAIDSLGNLYISDVLHNRVVKATNGVISTVVGTGIPGFRGDGGLALEAELNQPGGIAIDSEDRLFIADSLNHRIRRVSDGLIATVAGSALQGVSGDDEKATNAKLNQPEGVAVDSAGNLFIADTGNRLVRKVSNGVISTLAGGGSSLGDGGQATGALLVNPRGVAVDSAGRIYIADAGDHRVRILIPDEGAGLLRSPTPALRSTTSTPESFTSRSRPLGSAANSNTGVQTSVSVNYTGRKGNFLVVACATSGGTGSLTITDDINRYALDKFQSAGSSLQEHISLTHATNITGGPSSITCTASTPVAHGLMIRVVEYSAISGVVDGTIMGASGNGTTVNCGSLGTTRDNDLLIEAIVYSGVNMPILDSESALVGSSSASGLILALVEHSASALHRSSGSTTTVPRTRWGAIAAAYTSPRTVGKVVHRVISH